VRSTDPKDEEISRLIRTTRRQYDHFISLLTYRDRLAAVGASLDDTYRILAKIDRDITANESALARLGCMPRHQKAAKEKPHDPARHSQVLLDGPGYGEARASGDGQSDRQRVREV
jgi:hypothetical protein